MEATRKEQAATELMLAQHDAAIPPPQKKRKYRIVNQHLAMFKQVHVMGERSVLSFLLGDVHLLVIDDSYLLMLE